MPNPPELQDDHHGHGHHSTDRSATIFVYASLAALVVWIAAFLIFMPTPERW